MAARGLMVLAASLLECHTASALAMHLISPRLFLPAPRLPPPALAMHRIPDPPPVPTNRGAAPKT
eukprot:scaffold102918_cov67-Phaeocystis_antarctica.AAC.5